MLTCIKDDYGNILAACEWRKVDRNCKFDIYGKCIWIHTVEVSKPYWNKGLLFRLVEAVISEMPDFEYASFRREKYGLRIRGYTRNRWLKLKEKSYAVAY